MKKNGFWIAVVSALFAGALLWTLLSRQAAAPGTVASVRVDGQEVLRLDLSAVTGEQRREIRTEKGVNTVAVRPGAICVIDADCPDQVCVRQGWLTGGSAPIVCLPHRLVITLEAGGDEEAPDAVAG